MIELFPTKVLKSMMPDYDKAKTIQSLEPLFDKHDPKYATNLSLSSTGKDISTSTNGLLFIHKEKGLADVVKFINEQVELYWTDAQFTNQPAIQYMWANKYFRDGYASVHNHSPHTLSGVFYVDIEDDDMGQIYFQDPNSALRCTQPQCHEFRVTHNSTSISVRSGDLLIFPSWLNHGTYPNKTDNTKISIAFDIGFRGLELLRKLSNTL